MAVKALVLRKKLTDAQRELEALRKAGEAFETREAEIAKAVEEAASEEEMTAVEEAADAFEAEKAEHDQKVDDLEQRIQNLENELADEEARQNTNTTTPPAEPEKREKEIRTMNQRYIFNMPTAELNTYFERDDVKAWLSEIRACIKEKRALTNVGLTIPNVFLGLLREALSKYSKLYRYVNVRRVGGSAREVIMGSVPEGVWTECCANLNELSLGFNDVEVDCFKVGGYFKVCNAVLEDNDVDLADVLLDSIGQAIGYALDKAILYGRNAVTTQKMPQGVMSRLVQTEAPATYPATARTWVDLHTTNIKSITAANSTGIKLFQEILKASGAMKSSYARMGKVWIMNETTLTTLQAEAMNFNAAGAIVSGMGKTMPVIGGDVVVLDFIPNNVIVAGYFEQYLLAERAGSKFAQSEHAFFIQDQTAFKGTARYDGVPVIAEAFMAIGISGTTPNATMTFASDTANA